MKRKRLPKKTQQILARFRDRGTVPNLVRNARAELFAIYKHEGIISARLAFAQLLQAGGSLKHTWRLSDKQVTVLQENIASFMQQVEKKHEKNAGN